MTQPESVLEQLVAGATWRPDWDEVLSRAGEGKRRRLLTRRRVILVAALAAAVIIPFAAVAAANDWWFLGTPGSPTPTSAPVIVKTGVWDGHPWQLVAYPSQGDGLCLSMIPMARGAGSYGSAMGCGTKPGAADMKITFLSGSPTSVLPGYVVGPVIEQATTVAIRFSDGTTVHTPTFAGPSTLHHLRFYAVRLPGDQAESSTTGPPFGPTAIAWVAGVDQDGHVVACLAPADARNGISPPSACG